MVGTEEQQSSAVPLGELERIRAAYGRRDHANSGERYSYFRPAFVLERSDLVARILSLLNRSGLTDLKRTRILDVGCGIGSWLRQFMEWGARPENLFGVDLLEDRISECKKLSPGAVTVCCGDASRLSFDDASFDLVLQFTVFTSILDSQMRRRLAGEMFRVLKPGGAVLWYDYFVSNPRNPDVRGVTRKEISTLFPECTIALERVTLAPPLGRVIGPVSATLYHMLSSVKPLCTHYLGLFQKP